MTNSVSTGFITRFDSGVSAIATLMNWRRRLETADCSARDRSARHWCAVSYPLASLSTDAKRASICWPFCMRLLTGSSFCLVPLLHRVACRAEPPRGVGELYGFMMLCTCATSGSTLMCVPACRRHRDLRFVKGQPDLLTRRAAITRRASFTISAGRPGLVRRAPL
jgi:hypothetical protein